MNAIKTVKSKWGMAEGWARKTIVGLVWLLIVGAASFIVTSAVNAPSASEVNTMIDLKIAASPILTKGAEGAINQLVLDNTVEHQEMKTELKLMQGDLNYIREAVKEIKHVANQRVQ